LLPESANWGYFYAAGGCVGHCGYGMSTEQELLADMLLLLLGLYNACYNASLESLCSLPVMVA